MLFSVEINSSLYWTRNIPLNSDSADVHKGGEELFQHFNYPTWKQNTTQQDITQVMRGLIQLIKHFWN